MFEPTGPLSGVPFIELPAGCGSVIAPTGPTNLGYANTVGKKPLIRGSPSLRIEPEVSGKFGNGPTDPPDLPSNSAGIVFRCFKILTPRNPPFSF